MTFTDPPDTAHTGHTFEVQRVATPGWSGHSPKTWFHHRCSECGLYDIWDPQGAEWISTAVRLAVPCVGKDPTHIRVGRFLVRANPAGRQFRFEDRFWHSVLVSENMGLYSAYVDLVEDPRFTLFGSPPQTVPGLEVEHKTWLERKGTKKAPITQPLWKLSTAVLYRVVERCREADTLWPPIKKSTRPNHEFRLAWLRREAQRYRQSVYSLDLANWCERLADMMEDGLEYEVGLLMNKGFA